MMTCERYETEIALLVSGDLPGWKARTVKRHVGECVTCRAVEAEFREGQVALRALCKPDIDRGLREALHERVLGAVAQSDDGHAADLSDEENASLTIGTFSLDNSRCRRRRVAVSIGYVGLAVIVSCATVIGWMLHEAEPHINAPVQTAMAPPNVQAPPGSTDTGISGSQISNPQVVNSIRGNSKQSTVVRMYTSDPRVVIFLVSDQTGG